MGYLRKRLVQDLEYAVNVLLNAQIYIYDGVKVPVRASRELRDLKRRLYRGGHERPEIDAVGRMLTPSDVVLEIGAGTGILSTFIAKRLSGKTLHAFEANPTMRTSIEAVLSENGVGASIYPVAVGRTAGKMMFYVMDNFESSSSTDRGGKQIEVDVVAFADLLGTHRPSFVIMDVEGAERELLADPLPACVRKVCVEIHPHVIGNAASSTIVHSMLGQGFELAIDQTNRRVFSFAR